MILIFTEKKDISATKVTEYLLHYKIPFLRIDAEYTKKIINKININNTDVDIIITYKGKNYSIKQFAIIWNRRGYFKVNLPNVDLIHIKNNKLKHIVYKQLKEERETLLNFIYHKMSDQFHINDPRVYNINKLIVLDAAVSCGLQIPNTYIFNNLNYLKENQKYITKNIQDIMIYYKENEYLEQGTKKVLKNNNKNKVFYSLFQEEITKFWEIRVFVFFKETFSMAIFSQNNTKTKIDFKDYDNAKPNRMVPFKLPKEIKKKLLKLMSNLNLNSGSIDLIYDGKQYIFLEVNPVGQFDFVSLLCNYNIENTVVR